MLAQATGISLRSVQRILEAHRIAPHRIRTFKLSNDPNFAAKLKNIVGLYGAETIVYLASSPDVAKTTGQYFYKSVPTTPSSWAQDDRSALLLWRRSAALAGMKE